MPQQASGKRSYFGQCFVLDTADERKTAGIRKRRSSQPKDLDAGPFEAEAGSFRLHLAAEGKAPRTLRTYTEAVRWFAAAHVPYQASPGRIR